MTVALGLSKREIYVVFIAKIKVQMWEEREIKTTARKSIYVLSLSQHAYETRGGTKGRAGQGVGRAGRVECLPEVTSVDLDVEQALTHG